MRAIHVIAGLDQNHGGPSYSVPRLCDALRLQDVHTCIHTVRGTGTPRNPFILAHEPSFPSIPILRSLRISIDLAQSIRKGVTSADVVHTHGLWLMPNVSAGKSARAARRPLIVSPRGMLAAEALAFSSFRKRFFWHLAQRPAYADAAVWHATSEAEAIDIRRFGIRAPIAIVPNGIDVPDDCQMPKSENTTNTILYLGRLHPQKGIPNLLTAWSRIAGELPDWTLRIVGPDDNGHLLELMRIVSAAEVPRVTFEGPQYGEDKLKVLRDADLFVLPTQNENFGIAVAEALSVGVPAIVTHGAPWRSLETERCGWWIEHGVEPLVNVLRQATALSTIDRSCMGERGRAFVERAYKWDSIARKMRSVYEWVTGLGQRPSFVHLD